METDSVRTFISKTGDVQADRQIQAILSQGWKIATVTANGSVRITTFNKKLETIPHSCYN